MICAKCYCPLSDGVQFCEQCGQGIHEPAIVKAPTAKLSNAGLILLVFLGLSALSGGAVCGHQSSIFVAAAPIGAELYYCHDWSKSEQHALADTGHNANVNTVSHDCPVSTDPA